MDVLNKDLVVTVKVLTYNSSRYVLETLESIKAQTYPYLALVISDDCSTDKTVKICKEWVEKNKDRFVSAQILESSVNTGVSANDNRAEKACSTTWVKTLAGDDLLLPNCIQDNMDYVEEHLETVYLFSKINVFGGKKSTNDSLRNYFNDDFFKLSAEEQYKELVFGECKIAAPTGFYNIKKIRELGLLVDERIPMMNDRPKWINALKSGITFHFMDKETVGYRVHQKSLSTSKYKSPVFFRSLQLFYYYYQRDEFIKKYGLDKVIEDEVNNVVKIYTNFFESRRLLMSKIYFLFKRIIKKIRHE